MAELRQAIRDRDEAYERMRRLAPALDRPAAERCLDDRQRRLLARHEAAERRVEELRRRLRARDAGAGAGRADRSAADRSAADRP